MLSFEIITLINCQANTISAPSQMPECILSKCMIDLVPLIQSLAKQSCLTSHVQWVNKAEIMAPSQEAVPSIYLRCAQMTK